MAEPTKRSLIKDLREVTEKEKIEVVNVWKTVEKDYTYYGKIVFQRLFELHPNYKRFFIDILEPDEDPFENARFQKHMLQVLLPTLGGVVQHLDQPEAVYEAMKRLGFMHKRREFGLRKENVLVLGQNVVQALRMYVKEMTDEQEAALSKVLNIVLAMFSNALEGKLD